MKILIYSDNHFCKYSSILRKRGKVFSYRLENQLKSLEWVRNTATENNCDLVLCLGDFFDKPTLDCEEITALGTASFFEKTAYLVGNHESTMSSLYFNTTNVFKDSTIFFNPCAYVVDDTQLCFLPYVAEENRTPLEEVFGDYPDGVKYRIIFSHNDLKIRYGAHESSVGYSVDEIKKNCDMFFNGHIHHSAVINDGTKGTIINVGNLTGQNFSETNESKHGVYILDTVNHFLDFIDNPFAVHFYQYKFDTEDFNEIRNALLGMNNDEEKVVSVSVPKEFVQQTRELIDSFGEAVVQSKILSIPKVGAEQNYDKETVDIQISYLDKFAEYVKQNIGNDKVTLDEVVEVTK